MSMEHVRAQGSLRVERGVCNDPERLRLERVPMSPIGPIGPISPHFLVSPTSFRSSQGPQAARRRETLDRTAVWERTWIIMGYEG